MPKTPGSLGFGFVTSMHLCAGFFFGVALGMQGLPSSTSPFLGLAARVAIFVLAGVFYLIARIKGIQFQRKFGLYAEPAAPSF
jgi:hypothetical protein